MLPNRTEATYHGLFEVVKQKLPLFELEAVMVDFENAGKYEKQLSLKCIPLLVRLSSIYTQLSFKFPNSSQRSVESFLKGSTNGMFISFCSKFLSQAVRTRL